MCRPPFAWLRLLAVLLLVAGAPRAVFAQEVTVQGRVVDRSSAPIPGAVVTVQNTTIRTRTNSGGEFSIVAPSGNATLVVTAPTFGSAQVALAGRTRVEVQLSPQVVQLEELVVVGYGTQQKSDVTGAVASVNTERLRNTPTVSVEQSLQGAIPGVAVATQGAGAEGNSRIQIRGRSSINASSEPLIVIDGIPFNGNLTEINQNDIASLEVLKDASSAAIYGSRGSNGVVLITTRRGGTKPTVSYEMYAGVQETSNVPELMSGEEFAAYKCQRLSAGANCENALTASELAALRNGGGTDWLGLATRRGNTQSHNLSFSGGTGGTRYYITGSFLGVAGVARNDEFKRYTARVNLDQELSSWLRLGTNTQASLVDRSGVPASFENAFFMNPLTTPFNEDGTQRTTPWAEDTFWGNPLEGFLVTDDDHARRIFTSNYAEAGLPLRGLTARVNAGLDYVDRDQRRYYGRDTRTGETSQGRAQIYSNQRWDWTLEGLLNYQRTLGRHGLHLTGLLSTQGNNLEGDSLRAEGFPNDVLTYYQARVGSLVVPGSGVVESRLVSQMGRLNYSFDRRYLVTLTARRDGFSGFGANHKWGVFPSAALGWNVSNEGFWKVDAVNDLKLRASWGRNGNQAIVPYQTLAGLDEFSYVEGDVTLPGYISRTLGNPDLRWETTTAWNAGMDFGMWGNRVRGSFDLYRRNTSDLLLNRAISPVHGVTRVLQNIGKTRNAGMELQLSTRNVNRESFAWTTDLTFARNRNRIVDLYGDGQDDVASGWFIGESIDVNYAYRFGGIWQVGDDIAGSAQPTAKAGDVRIVDLNGDGKITPDDRTVIGNYDPSYTASLFNTVRVRDFSVTASLYSVQGLTRSNALLGTNLVQAGVRRNTVRRQYWTPDNRLNSYPANSETSNPLSIPFFEDASYVRLRDVTLSYDVPGSFSGRFGAQSLRLYVNGHNLWTSTEWSGLDPELSENTGIQRSVPLERTFTAGINVRF